MIKRNLQTVASLAASSPFSEGQLRWWIFIASSNGLEAAGAVVRVGRRVYIDIDRFDDWIEQQNNGHPLAGTHQSVHPGVVRG
jgi:hypothetical protein